MKDGVFICVLETSCPTPGSMEYNFNTGEFQAHKPETMRNIRWLYYLVGFIGICRRMVRSVPVNDFDLE